ncbi:MAG: carboxypeptidase-like regulatory domain-containing protein [Bacteroidota bacterium]
MRILTIVLALAFAPILGQAQNTVTGKIVDELGLPIYMAGITLDATKDVVYTNYDGNFTLSSEKDFHWKITISSVGYKTESFFVLDGGNAGEIMLEYGDELRELLISEQSLPDNLKKP